MTASEFTGFRAPEVSLLSPADVVKKVVATGTTTDQCIRKVFHCEFGSWPAPPVEHPDAISISDYVAELEKGDPNIHEGLADARKSLSSWLFKSENSLRAMRLRAGLSQMQLAELANTSQPQIARLEAGKQDPTLSTLRKLARALRVDLDSLALCFHD